jgi:hypothetical protein
VESRRLAGTAHHPTRRRAHGPPGPGSRFLFRFDGPSSRERRGSSPRVTRARARRWTWRTGRKNVEGPQVFSPCTTPTRGTKSLRPAGPAHDRTGFRSLDPSGASHDRSGNPDRTALDPRGPRTIGPESGPNSPRPSGSAHDRSGVRTEQPSTLGVRARSVRNPARRAAMRSSRPAAVRSSPCLTWGEPSADRRRSSRGEGQPRRGRRHSSQQEPLADLAPRRRQLRFVRSDGEECVAGLARTVTTTTTAPRIPRCPRGHSLDGTTSTLRYDDDHGAPRCPRGRESPAPGSESAQLDEVAGRALAGLGLRAQALKSAREALAARDEPVRLEALVREAFVALPTPGARASWSSALESIGRARSRRVVVLFRQE